jgi:hypothetical protein
MKESSNELSESFDRKILGNDVPGDSISKVSVERLGNERVIQ